MEPGHGGRSGLGLRGRQRFGSHHDENVLKPWCVAVRLVDRNPGEHLLPIFGEDKLRAFEWLDVLSEITCPLTQSGGLGVLKVLCAYVVGGALEDELQAS
jgi:hypothetical protein